MQRFLLATLLLLIVAVWGWTFVLVKDAVAVYAVVPFLAVRFAIGSVCIAPFAIRSMRRRSLAVGGLIGIALALAYLMQTIGLDGGTATNAGVITGMFVVFAPMANRLLFGVRTSAVYWAAIAASLIGLGMLTGLGAKPPSIADLATLIGAAFFGLHVALLDRYSKRHDAVVLVWGQLLAATVIFSIAWPFTSPLIRPPAEAWPALLVTGVLATAVAFFIQTLVQQRLSAVETAMIILTEPIFAAVFGVLLHKDRLTPLQSLGAAVMIAAVFTAELVPLLRKKRRAATTSFAEQSDGASEPGTPPQSTLVGTAETTTVPKKRNGE